MEKPKIHQAMASILNKIEAIKKAQQNTQQKYNFRGIDDVYNSLHPIFKEVGVFMIPEVVSCDREQRESKSGGTNIWTLLTVKFHFVADDGSEITATMKGEAMDSGDKGTNKALSVAQKYCLMQTFLIPTEEGALDTDKAEADDTYGPLLKEIKSFDSKAELTAWANSKKEMHKDKTFIKLVSDQLKTLKA